MSETYVWALMLSDLNQAFLTPYLECILFLYMEPNVTPNGLSAVIFSTPTSYSFIFMIINVNNQTKYRLPQYYVNCDTD